MAPDSKTETGAAAVLWRAIDDGRNAIVRRNREEFRPELLALAYIDRQDPVRQPRLFEENRDLMAVRGRPIVKIDHCFPRA